MVRHLEIEVEKKHHNGDCCWRARCTDAHGSVGEAEHSDLREAQILSVAEYYKKLYESGTTSKSGS
jgi:hypothetical protein